jgi:hypothetical protein
MINEELKNTIIKKYRAYESFGTRKILQVIPEAERKYKCHTCHLIVDESPCPSCNETHLEIMCPLDHCECPHTDPIQVIAYCPLCGEAVCPECGTHDCVQISRVTGYLSDVSGWHEGKKQELKDRKRYTV